MGGIQAARRLMQKICFSNHMQRYVLYKRFSYLKTLKEIEQHGIIQHYRNPEKFVLMPRLTTLKVCGGRGFFTNSEDGEV